MVHMQSTLEELPDEILMIIFGYSDDIYSLFQTFLGLNQRINNILLDKRLHLFINFLCINIDHETMCFYYNSSEFQHITRILKSLNGTVNNNEIIQSCLESLVRFHIQNRYIQLENEFQLNQKHFQIIRKQMAHSEIQKIDNELQLACRELVTASNLTHKIHSLIYTRGACIKYDDPQIDSFDLARTISNQIVVYFQFPLKYSRKHFDHLMSIFKGLIISNPKLLKNSQYLSYGLDVLHCLLITIFKRAFIYTRQSCTTNLYYYQSLIDLILLSIRSLLNVNLWSTSYLYEILSLMKSKEESISNIIIQTTEMELLKILLNEFNLDLNESCDDDPNHSLAYALNRLIKTDRMDIVLMMYRHNKTVRDLFQKTDYMEKNVDIMLGNHKTKQLLNQLIDEKPLNTCFTTRKFLFQLLGKKQFEMVKKLLKLSISVLNEIDENGNDILLYLCLKVRGCRHRFIEYLIKMGCNTQRINYCGQSFFNAIELKQNQKLLNKLFEHEIILFDNLTVKIIISTNLFE
ncbi:unnamed protein product [Adineta steineri]|uniref:Uncharacterized protein n=2 Tax=Adineta steineri TaxID=433720 RepID=A0A819VFZ6_9BILA|nr:unnamed protein product [Adineta steineri]CAF4107989.1 unnamed protein product [Adineta steineri]